jgi:zinc transport system ATP-binding protein
VGHKKIGDLSGGQFQRVMIARAMLHEKSILAFDEPLSGIDIAGEATVYDLITKVNQEKKTTCLIVSHELNIVNRYSSRVICINNTICCSGKPEEVLTPQAIRSLYGGQAGFYHQHK